MSRELQIIASPTIARCWENFVSFFLKDQNNVVPFLPPASTLPQKLIPVGTEGAAITPFQAVSQLARGILTAGQNLLSCPCHHSTGPARLPAWDPRAEACVLSPCGFFDRIVGQGKTFTQTSKQCHH